MKSVPCWWSSVAALLVWISAGSALAAATPPHYVITNDDAPFSNSVTFYTVGADGLLTRKGQLFTGGAGIGGGFFGANRISVGGNEECVYASDASTGDIVGINLRTLKVGDPTFASPTDAGTSNGIGLVANAQYLYASFTDSNTIATFQIQPGQVQPACALTFVNDVSVSGLQGGIIDGMAVHGNMLVATYGDGSIESFNISAGTPVSNGDKQNSTAYLKSSGVNYPNGIEITKNGHYAIFADTSTSTVVEVSDISSGNLGRTVAFALGSARNSGNILLSPDETLLYISNTQGDSITAAWFDKNTGKLTAGCTSNPLKGYSSHWSYLGSLALSTNSGTGGTLYVAEFGSPSFIGMVEVTSAAGTCTLQESSSSPIYDPNSPGLLSIGAFPPRSF